MEEPSYTYEDPRKLGATRKTTRTLLRVIHNYFLPYTYEDKDGVHHMIKYEEHRHPNLLLKILCTLLFPASVVMIGAPHTWEDWKRCMWDRKYGGFICDTWFRPRDE